MYLGAKHMVTGYDHLLFLVGVIFFLYRLKDVLLYVSLFTIGHSLTLLGGVLGGIHANPYLIDAIIGFSVVYKAFENMDGFRRLFGVQPDTRAAVLIFGLFHGFGLATKLQDFELSPNGLVANIVSFNIGVEIGQGLALTFILIALTYWRTRSGFLRHAFATNAIVMACGFLLVGYQLSGYFLAASIMASEIQIRNPKPRSERVNGSTQAIASHGCRGWRGAARGGAAARDVRPAGGVRGRSARHGRASSDCSTSAMTGQQVEALEAAKATAPPAERRSSRRRTRRSQQETVEFQVKPREGFEYKYRLEKGEALLYSWKSSAPVKLEFHAEPDGGPRGYAQTYEKKHGMTAASGTLTAPFSGIHGWYWENTTDKDVTVTLASSGYYNLAHEFRSAQPVKNKNFK